MLVSAQTIRYASKRENVPSLQVSPETAVLQLLCQDRLYPSDIWLATAYLFPCQDQMPSPCAKIDVLWLLV